MQELRLVIEGYDDSDAEERAKLALTLRQVLLNLDDVEDVRHPTREPPSGARGDALAWAELIVSVSGGLPGVVAALQAWHRRHEACELTLERGGERISLRGAGPKQQREMLEAWLEREDERR